MYISSYLCKNILVDKELLIISLISFEDGHRSFKKTLSPLLLIPIESVNKLIFIFPAIAKATTSGGEARKLALTS